MTLNETLMAGAEDIKAYCLHNSCYEDVEEDDGRIYRTNVCPFYSDGCVLDDPSMWNLKGDR